MKSKHRTTIKTRSARDQQAPRLCATQLSSKGAAAALDVVASSDHLLTNIGLLTSGNSVILNVEGRSVVIRNGELLIEGAVECLIPPGSRHVEFAATGDVLRIMVDGKIIREAR